MMKIAIVNYGMGNLRSVMNAFEFLGKPAYIANQPDDIQDADKIILPGVGAFGDAMKNLRSAGWVDALNEQVMHRGKSFLGLCLGMQLLATTSTEHGLHHGLNWIAGTVSRITPKDSSLRVPHIGWNEVRFIKNEGLFGNLGKSVDFYFVHSFVFHPDDPAVISGLCDYGGEFVACIGFNNIFATQFHPEKSQKSGLTVLRNFIRCSG
jgi:glutamine amidotransferase